MPCQKNSAPFRFRASRKSRESCMSAEFFFLSRIGPAPPGFDPDTGPLHRNEGILSDALVKLSTKCRQLDEAKMGTSEKAPIFAQKKVLADFFACASAAAHFGVRPNAIPRKRLRFSLFRTASDCTRGGPCPLELPPLLCQLTWQHHFLTVSGTRASFRMPSFRLSALYRLER